MKKQLAVVSNYCPKCKKVTPHREGQNRWTATKGHVHDIECGICGDRRQIAGRAQDSN